MQSDDTTSKWITVLTLLEYSVLLGLTLTRVTNQTTVAEPSHPLMTIPDHKYTQEWIKEHDKEPEVLERSEIPIQSNVDLNRGSIAHFKRLEGSSANLSVPCLGTITLSEVPCPGLDWSALFRLLALQCMLVLWLKWLTETTRCTNLAW